MSASRKYSDSFFAETAPGSLASARVVVPVLLELMAPNTPRSAVDFGCGLGGWLKALREHGVSSVLGIDGNYVDRRLLLINHNEFLVGDLEKAPPSVGPFDLALCLEVVEHLSKSAARPLVERLTAAAPLVLFSAAVPGQGGTQHLNEQWPAYWAKHFEECGFKMSDIIRLRLLGDSRVDWWYRQNMAVFIRGDALQKYPLLAPSASPTPSLGLEWVHVEVAFSPATVLGRAPVATLQWLWRRIPLPAVFRSRARRIIRKSQSEQPAEFRDAP